MSEKVRHKINLGLLVIVIIFALGVASFFIWLLKPYPKVTISGESRVINTPVSGTFETGDVIRWETDEVCQPAGRTTADVFAVLEFQTEYGVAASRTPIVSRDFQIPSGFPGCVKDNPTSAYVDGDLPTGTYRFEIVACVYNPTPQPECKTFQGPSNVRIKRVVGNE
jgi:hypothetical protein